MAITIEQVRELREQTGISIMQCKKALEESNGDLEKAIIVLRKHGSTVAGKKSGRVLKAGVVQAYIHTTGDVGAMVELSCETDFVAKNKEFIALAYDIAMHAAATNPECINRGEVSESAQKAAREVFEKETASHTKSQQAEKQKDLKEKIISGKLDVYFSDKVLLEQKFIKNPEQTINDLIEAAVQRFGEKIEITAFVRFSVRT